MREQLADVMKHADMKMWCLNQNREITFFEGQRPGTEDVSSMSSSYEDVIGKNVYDVFPAQIQAIYRADPHGTVIARGSGIRE